MCVDKRLVLKVMMWHPLPSNCRVGLVDRLTNAEVDTLLVHAVGRGATIGALLGALIGSFNYFMIRQVFSVSGSRPLFTWWNLLHLAVCVCLLLLLIALGRSTSRWFNGFLARVKESGRSIDPD
jgi:hypothetical protein